MLNTFRKSKMKEIVQLQKMAETGSMPLPYTGARPALTKSLRSQNGIPSVIAEYKRASPSRGVLHSSLTPEETAQAYAAAGAKAMSVLTEEEYFQGHLSFLSRAACAGLPLLRKDFILHPLQIEQTASTPASAVLLIARMLDEQKLTALLAHCRRYGLEAVTEIFDVKDLAIARKAGAEIIQVNNRDLDRLTVDLAISQRIVRHKDKNEFWITASGVESPDQLEMLIDMGFDAALVGSFLMQAGTPGEALRSLLRGAS